LKATDNDTTCNMLFQAPKFKTLAIKEEDNTEYKDAQDKLY